MIELKTSFKSREVTEGAGARVRRLFPQVIGDFHDPFVLLDEFFISPSTGFPDHPHRGFEGITYMKEGQFRHADNLGNDRTLGPGAVQRFTAGKGIVHSEMPGDAPVNHGFQLWINLPSKLKGIEPSYQAVESDQIPEVRRNGVRIRTLIGPGSPVIVHSDVLFQEIIMGTGAEHSFTLEPEHRGVLYVFTGKISFYELEVGRSTAIELSGGEKAEIVSRNQSGMVLISGLPHNEPIYLNGSFVD